MEDEASVGGDENAEAMATSEDVCDQVPGCEITLTGYVVVSSGIATISDTLAESYPPQPGGDWLTIVNPEALDLDEMRSFAGTTWTVSRVRLFGRTTTDGFEIATSETGSRPQAVCIEGSSNGARND